MTEGLREKLSMGVVVVVGTALWLLLIVVAGAAILFERICAFVGVYFGRVGPRPCPGTSQRGESPAQTIQCEQRP